LIGNNLLIFFDEWRPILIHRQTDKNGGDEDLKITVIRGTIDSDQFIIDALDFYNEKTKSVFNNRRFRISYLFGRNNRDEESPLNKTASSSDEGAIERGEARLLKWTLDDLGYEFDYKDKEINILAFPKNVEVVIDDIKKWKDSEQWYRSKGIPWKRGWLLYGKPGTGKTSLTRAIAESLDIPIFILDLATLTNEELLDGWRRAARNTPCIVLMEDIDNVFEGRKNVYEGNSMKDKLSFGSLLNCLDGVERSDGIFTVVTSNRIETLDPALGTSEIKNGTNISSRPGRIDVSLELKELDEACRRKIGKRILEDCEYLIESTVKDGEGDTGAQFQERCTQIALREYWRK